MKVWLGVSADNLVVRNFLREEPLSLIRLCDFAGHSHAYIKLLVSRLRGAGRLFDDDQHKNKVNMNHAANRIAVEQGPLPDPPETNIHNTNKLAQEEGRRMALRAVAGESKGVIPELRKGRSIAEIRRILERYVDNGGKNGDIVGACRALIDIGDIDDKLGPGEPIGIPGYTKRLLSLMLVAPEPAVTAAIAQWMKRPDLADPIPSEALNANTQVTGDDALEHTGEADYDPAPEADGAEPSDPQLPQAGWDKEHWPFGDPQGPEEAVGGSS